MEKNRINFAKYQLFRYVDDLFVCISELINPEIEQSMNDKSHGLNEEELKVVLYEMFSSYMLVAMSEERGLFTPTLVEIEAALKENNDLLYRSKNTFYGLTTGGIETYRDLEAVYGTQT